MAKVKNKSKAISYRAYARRKGVSPEAVSKAVRTGRITATSNGKIDPDKADREWEANTDPSRNVQRTAKPPKDDADAASTATAGGVPPYLQSRSIREAYEARLSKLDYEVKSGKLVNVDEMKVVAFNTARMARDKLMNMPDRLAPLLAGISDSHEIHRLLNAEIRLICEELSSDASKSNRSHIP